MKRTIITIFIFIFSLSIFANNNVDTLKDSLSYFEGLKKAETLLIIGNHYFPNNNDSALLYIERALIEYERINNEKGMASSYGLLGAIYSDYGMYDTAIALTYKVIDWGEKNNDLRAFIAYLELANMYNSMNQLDKAKKFYHKAINGSYIPAKRAAFANMGLLNLKNEEYDSASYYFTGALKEYYKTDTTLHINKYNIATMYLNLASVDYAKGEYENGIKQLRQSLSIYNEIDNKSYIVKVYLKLGQGYEYLHKDDISLGYFYKAKQIADSLYMSPIMEEVYLSLFEHYQKKGDFENALLYHIEFDNIRDSLVIQSYKTSITEIEVKYNVQNKINKIASLEKEKQIVFNYSIIIVLGLLLISSIIILILNNRRLKYRNAKVLSDAKFNLSRAKAKSAQQELDRIVVSLLEKSAFIEELEEEVKKLSINNEKIVLEDKIQLLRETKILTDDDWERYNRIFNEIHPLFCNSVNNFDELSNGDKRQIIFLKLGLSQNEIAHLMGITPEGVKRARQRVAKKIGLSSTIELEKYVESL